MLLFHNRFINTTTLVFVLLNTLNILDYLWLLCNKVVGIPVGIKVSLSIGRVKKKSRRIDTMTVICEIIVLN